MLTAIITTTPSVSSISTTLAASQSNPPSTTEQDNGGSLSQEIAEVENNDNVALLTEEKTVTEIVMSASLDTKPAASEGEIFQLHNQYARAAYFHT